MNRHMCRPLTSTGLHALSVNDTPIAGFCKITIRGALKVMPPICFPGNSKTESIIMSLDRANVQLKKKNTIFPQSLPVMNKSLHATLIKISTRGDDLLYEGIVVSRRLSAYRCSLNQL